MQNVLRKSMITLMKSRKADGVENIQADSHSTDFEALFMEHWGHVYRALFRLVGDPAEAEDLALETFFRLYKRYPLPTSDFNLGGWLHRVATNLGLHSIRSFKRRESYETASAKGVLGEDSETSPAKLLEQEEERRLARLVLAGMKEQQAQLLVLRYSGLAYKEIADTLGLSPASIGPLLLRAEREFEKRYRALAEDEI
jgi:RNA polymerase sigma-70 factor, ECF subfamily